MSSPYGYGGRLQDSPPGPPPGVLPPPQEIRELGENCPGEFCRDVIEPLADSFDAAQAAAYERIMRAWIPARAVVTPSIPDQVDAVYVLSRVTLGADIKIVSPVLDGMKRRFQGARIGEPEIG